MTEHFSVHPNIVFKKSLETKLDTAHHLVLFSVLILVETGWNRVNQVIALTVMTSWSPRIDEWQSMEKYL